MGLDENLTFPAKYEKSEHRSAGEKSGAMAQVGLNVQAGAGFVAGLSGIASLCLII